VVARRETGHFSSDLHHDAGGLMPEDRGARQLEDAAKVVQVAVAQAGGRRPDPQLTGPYR
jgi:hypothetical protein